MSQMMEKSTENPSEDRASFKSNGSIKSDEKLSTDGGTKLGRLRSFRKSIQHATQNSPLSSVKGSKVTSKSDTPTNESDSAASPPPPSPSLSTDSLATPLKNNQKKEDDEADASFRISKPLTRSKTDPGISKFSNSFMKRGASIRRSLKMVTKKDTDKISTKAISEASVEEDMEEKEEEEVLREEIEDCYVLPSIPLTPLSVMEINKLIETGELEEAHLNLLSLRQEFKQQSESCPDGSAMELATREKDLNLLYGMLRKKVSDIVCDPLSDKKLLLQMARVIQEEEKRLREPGGLKDSWMDAWRESVSAGVQVKVQSVHLDRIEQNSAWLAVHLGLLGEVIVKDLENVKQELRWSYPPSFKVFSTYVRRYNIVVAQHLKKLEQQVTELKDFYGLLDWIVNKYKSERIMGSLSLQPDIQDESTDLQLEENFLEQLREKYCRRMQEELRKIQDRVIELENEEVWKDGKAPEKEDNFPISSFPIDILTSVKSFILNSIKLDAQLEKKVVSSCFEELKQFPNGKHMEEYKETCEDGVKGFQKAVDSLIDKLMRDLEDQFKEDVKPYLRRMMTRKWLTNDEDFDQLYSRTKLLSQHCSLMMPPHAKAFASKLHYHVVIEYIGQLMKSNYSCKNRKHEKAATKIRHQWNKLSDLFEDMKSNDEWLYHVGDDLSNIIGQKNTTDIKNHLQPVVQHYPDFSKKHLVAVLYFRGLMRGHEHQLILRRLTALKKEVDIASSDRNQVLFSNMQVTVNTNCLSNFPYSCVSFLMPDN
ncbi:exocyst complex component 3-like protein 4 isoform X2 [Oreochromis aureus]|uniref:Exocyst complex component 3 n=1 Tax=Oreochromis aureus TaxID=47969 RepID=A0AAZ1WWD5_OREAU|nr:exocyst complex component 3-like protein 4 isoform X2 [Oreochromis aureus]